MPFSALKLRLSNFGIVLESNRQLHLNTQAGFGAFQRQVRVCINLLGCYICVIAMYVEGSLLHVTKCVRGVDPQSSTLGGWCKSVAYRSDITLTHVINCCACRDAEGSSY